MPKMRPDMDFLEDDSTPDVVGDDAQKTDEDNVSQNVHDLMIKNLTKKFSSEKIHSWKSTRTEANAVIDQHGMVKHKKKQLNIDKLLKLSDVDGKTKKSLRNFEKKQVIPKPLLKPVAQKAARQVNFKELSQEIQKYDPIVKQVRHADQLVFPAQEEKVTFGDTVKTALQSAIQSSSSAKNIEKDINNELVKSGENIEITEMFPTKKEQEILKSLSLETAEKLHNELRRRRILMSYQEAKFRRIRKIKSKRYHRLLKKNKLKNAVEEFQQLLSTDSEKAAEKLEELDRMRALERASLKHLNTGKWAKLNKIRSKYNEQARNDLNEQLKINQAMMKKRALLLADDNETDMITVPDDYDDNDQTKWITDDNDNTWKQTEQPDLNELADSYNPWLSNHKVKVSKKKSNIQKLEQTDQPKENVESIESLEKCIMNNVNQRIKDARLEQLKQRLADDDCKGIQETFHDQILNKTDSSDDEDNECDNGHQNNDNQVNNLDLNFIMDVKKRAIVSSEQIDLDDNEALDELDVDDINFEHGDTAKYLREAFDDDDVVAEFMQQKKQNESQNKDNEPAVLPGWGSWSGFGIKDKKKKKMKHKAHIKHKQNKIQCKLSNVICMDGIHIGQNNSSQANAKLIKPIGSTWCPQSVSKALKEPKIITYSGTIIEPMKPVTKQID